MNRRDFLLGLPAGAALLNALATDVAQAQSQSGTTTFAAHDLRARARELAQRPYRAPEATVPKEFTDLTYDQHRDIRFKPDASLWRGEGLQFEAQFFHPGFIFKETVEIYEVVDGRARRIEYTPALFDYGKNKPPAPNTKLGFSGFRLHYPLNRPDYYDEVTVFLGATYFRAVAKNQGYGVSARGLSIATADQKGEEFPTFRAFWLEKPAKGSNSVVVHALLDSRSTTGAYRFTIRPGETTIHDIEMALYPRVDITQVGIASLTSMFLFDVNDRVGVDDFRSAVHDSDGLLIRNGREEQIWRPLFNPRDLQVSVFNDANPRGFGLMQRDRRFEAYNDLESRFENRPSLWVEPIGDWGEGGVYLVEIPTKDEIHDNIVAFWRPREALKAKGEYIATYRLHWGSAQDAPKGLLRFTKTRTGAGPTDSRRFILEGTGEFPGGPDITGIRAQFGADKGEVRNLVVQPNPLAGGVRVSFELHTMSAPVIELRGQLFRGDTPVSEIWTYRWAQ